MMASEPLVFISYERDSSRDLARYLHDRLQQMGADIFLDVEDIEPGANWEATLERKLIGCRYLLLLLAPETLTSEWVRREIQMALRHHKEIIPLLIRGFSFSSPVPDEAKLLLERIDDFQGIRYDHDDPAPALNKIARQLGLTVNRPADVSSLSPPTGNQQIGGSGNTQINIGSMSGGSVVGKQTNHGTPPTSPRPQDMPPTAASLPERKPIRTELIVAVVSGLFLIIAGAIAIIPQLQQNQMAQQAMDATATAAQIGVFSTSTALAQIPSTNTIAPTLAPSETSVLSATPVPPTDTSMPPSPAPTSTSVVPTTAPTLPPTPVTTSGLAIGMQAEVRGSNETDGYQNLRTGVTRDDPVIQQVPARTVVTIIDGPVASEDRIWWKVRTPDGVEGWTIESSATRQTLVPVERTAALRLLADAETLTLVVTAGEPLDLSGLEFRVADGGRTIRLADDFTVLLLTEGKADPGACFVYRLDGSTTPLASACNKPELIFLRPVPRSDVFWYDSTMNRQRDIAIYQGGNRLAVCSATAPVCTIQWNEKTTMGYPCAATIISPRGATTLNIIRKTPNFNAPTVVSVRRDEPVTILEKQVQSEQAIWYHIADLEDNELGWLTSEYVLLSSNCPG